MSTPAADPQSLERDLLRRGSEQPAQAPADPLAPWGAAGPAPVGHWRRDVLGPAFESRTLPLPKDSAGAVVATLVRHLARRDAGMAWMPRLFARPRFAALFVHGRNDYFFQTELARQMAGCGAAFYALDLRRHGRSLRPGQTIGYVEDLRLYDQDIEAALRVIDAERPGLPLVLVGHSTGGLILTLWVDRHPQRAAGLILDSAWLEMQFMASARPALATVIERIAERNPLWGVPGGQLGVYNRSLAQGWAGSGFALPERLRAFPQDPAVRGWAFAPEWKRPGSYPAYAQWLHSVMDAQERVQKDVRLSCPVLSMCSTASASPTRWDPTVFRADVVLDVDVVVRRSVGLGPLVTVARFPGRHDLFLSDPDVRPRVYRTMARWLRGFVA